MRENEKEREEMKASRSKTFINEQRSPFQKLKLLTMSRVGAFIANP